MENPTNKKNTDEGIGWLTRPCYNVMLIALVILFTLQENGNRGDFLHVMLWLPLCLIVIANVINVFDFFKKRAKSKTENNVQPEDGDE